MTTIKLDKQITKDDEGRINLDTFFVGNLSITERTGNYKRRDKIRKEWKVITEKKFDKNREKYKNDQLATGRPRNWA